MTFYASFDHTMPDPKPVRGWFDTEIHDYVLPPAEDLLELSQQQWDDREGQGLWGVANGALVPYTQSPPALSLADQAQAMLSSPVTINCTVSELSGDYANSAQIRASATAVVSQINAGLGLPGGGATFNWPDLNNNEKLWPAPEFVAYAKALGNFAYECQQVIDGFSDQLPSTTLVVTASPALRERIHANAVT